MSLKIIQRGKTWHYVGTVAGQRIRGTTGTSNKEDAKRITSEIETKQWRASVDGIGSVVTFADAMQSYLDLKKPERFMLPLLDYWGDTKLTDITSGKIRLSAALIYPNVGNATLNRQVIAPTVAIINHAHALGWCGKMSGKRFPVDPKTKEPADAAWVQAFADQANTDGLPHMAALCLFMFGTGARVGQACDLTWAEVDLSAATAKIYTNKPTPWTRTAHLPKPVVQALEAIPSNRNHSHLVFGYPDRGSVTKTWANIINRADIEHLTPHCCRHGFATVMLQSGYDAKTVADAGGWRDVGVLMKTYAHALKDKTVTEALFDTKLTQRKTSLSVNT